MSFKVLVRNPGSELAILLEREFDELPYQMLCPGVEDFAWSNRKSLHSYFADQIPNVVVNLLPDVFNPSCVDQEQNATMALAGACLHYKIPLLQLSSFHVFGSEYFAAGYSETCEPKPSPQDTLAQFHHHIEQAVAHADQHMIIRLPWLLDLGNESLLAKTIPALLDSQKLTVSSYFQGSAVSKTFICSVLVACIKQILCGAENWGVFHLHTADFFSEAEFVDALSRLLKAELKQEITEADIIAEKDGARLLSGSANIKGRRITNNFGIQLPSWRLGFKGTTKAWLKSRGLKLPKAENR